MKNILYISSLDLDRNSGVEKKIKAQIKALKNLNTKVSYIATKGNEIYFCGDDNLVLIGRCSSNKIIKLMQLIKACIGLIKESNNIDLIYIRYIFTTPQIIKLLKIAKKKNIKVVEEVPTYPYDEEIERGKRLDLKLSLIVDKIFRRKLKKYLNNIVTLSEDDEIFGIKTIKINNGVDIENITPLDIKYDDNMLNMIVVSAIEYWQGYDRLIKSLKNYYENKQNTEPDITIHLVGDGGELENLKKLTENLGLNDKVVFYGFLSGEELENVYNKCQCAIAGLGIFRKNIPFAKTLKIREYISKAIPFVYSTTDKSIIDFKYAYKVSDDEEIFDMKAVINFLKSLNKDLIKKEMREFAEQNYRWEVQMEKVLKEVL